MAATVELVGLRAREIRSLAERGCTQVKGRGGRDALIWPAIDADAAEMSLRQLRIDPTSAPFLLHVLLVSGRLVGRIGCVSAPLGGVADVHYRVFDSEQADAVQCMMMIGFLRWLQCRGVTSFRLPLGARPDLLRALSDCSLSV